MWQLSFQLFQCLQTMKQRFLFVFLFSFAIHSTLNAQIFKIKTDTLFLNIKDIARPATRLYLTHAVKDNDKYYCFFYEVGLYSFNVESRYFLIISNNGTILNNIVVPEEIKNTDYFDFFMRRDSLFAKTYMDHESFLFDKNKLEWTKIYEVDDQVYEDSNYKVTYLDFGEWGQSTWFINKQTKKEYVLGASGTTVNILDGRYYLTNGSEIVEIEDPLNLKQCDKDNYYHFVEEETKLQQGSNSIKGSKAIYKDTTFSPRSFKEPKQTISTSFVTNNQLYQLYSDSSSTFIGKIENEKLIPVQNIGEKYATFDWHYSYRGNNRYNDSRFLKFREDNNTFGFIEIENSNIAIHYLKHNLDSLNYLGSDGFERLLELLKVNPSTFSLKQAVNIEMQLGGIDMRTDRVGISHNGYYPEVYNSLNNKTKEFIKVVDKIIAQETEYLYSASSTNVKSIFFEWLLTEPYKQTNTLEIFRKDKPEIQERFRNKQNEIIKIITEQLGFGPKRKKRGNDYFEFSWILKNGIEIILYGSDIFEGKKEIRMIINLK